MFDLSKELKSWRQNMRKKKHLEDGYIEELESHLLDEFDRLKKNISDEKIAFDKAAQNVGSNSEIEKEYKKSSSLISQPQPWQSNLAYVYLVLNYIKIAYRNIFKSKSYSIINIAGLSVGLACAFLIMLWVQDELSFDKFHNDVERIHRVYSEYPESGQAWQTPLTPDPLRDVLTNDYPEIELITRAKYKPGVIEYGDLKLKDETLAIVDDQFFKIFNFPLVRGDFNSIFGDPHSVVITDELSQKVFGETSPIGETITFDGNIDFIVAGVLKDYPTNTQFNSDLFVSYSFLKSTGAIEQGWIGGRAETYVKLNQNIASGSFETKIAGLGEANQPGCGYIFQIQPYEQIHLYSLTGEEEGMYYVYMFSIIGFFVLGMACINFMNLSTARSAKRAKEVGLRKVIGASRWQIIKQFYGESLLMTFISGIVALGLIYLVLPAFNEITQKEMSISILDLNYILGFALVLILTGLISGSYPALMLSSFTPSRILRRESERGLKGKAFRRALVVLQFSLAIGLVISAVIIQQQLSYMQNKSLGFDKENVMYLELTGVPFSKYETLKNEIKSLTGVQDASIASDLPSSIFVGLSRIDWEGKDPTEIVSFSFNSVDEDYLSTFGVELVDGSNFYGDMQADAARFIVNEKAAKIISDESPVGKRFSMWNTTGEIVGVVKDFHSKPLTSDLDPMLFTYYPAFYKYLFVKVAPNQMDNVLSGVENTWAQHAAGIDFEYKFLDDTLNERYANEKRIATLFEYFTGFAIFISLLGLVGLVSYTTQQRVKEIGIRKVLGASVPSILKMISKEFVAWIIVANVIAWPVVYYFMDGWLEEFAYRISLDFSLMLMIGLLAVVSSVIVISIQSLRAVLANPVDSIRTE